MLYKAHLARLQQEHEDRLREKVIYFITITKNQLILWNNHQAPTIRKPFSYETVSRSSQQASRDIHRRNTDVTKISLNCTHHAPRFLQYSKLAQERKDKQRMPINDQVYVKSAVMTTASFETKLSVRLSWCDAISTVGMICTIKRKKLKTQCIFLLNLMYFSPSSTITNAHVGTFMQQHLYALSVSLVDNTIVQRSKTVCVFIIRRSTQIK